MLAGGAESGDVADWGWRSKFAAVSGLADHDLSASWRKELASASSRVGTFTVPETISARTTSPPKSIPSSQFLLARNAARRPSS